MANTPTRFVLLDDPRRIGRNPTAKPWGTIAMLATLEEAEKVARASESPEPTFAVREGCAAWSRWLPL